MPGSDAAGVNGSADVFKLEADDEDSRASGSAGTLSRGGKSRGRELSW